MRRAVLTGHDEKPAVTSRAAVLAVLARGPRRDVRELAQVAQLLGADFERRTLGEALVRARRAGLARYGPRGWEATPAGLAWYAHARDAALCLFGADTP